MDPFNHAAICRRGHVIAFDLHDGYSYHCPECGAKVLTACGSCQERIRGPYKDAMYVDAWRPPPFCDNCGTPHPWASRQALFYQLENLLDDQELDPADELKVREELEALRAEPTVDEKSETQRWKTIQKISPGLMAAGERIVESLISATIKAHLGL